MRISAIVLLIVVVVSVFVPPAVSQTPYLGLYFDSQLTRHYEDCPMDPPGTVLDTMYVVAFDLNTFISAIEYRIDYPAQMIYLGDMENGGLNIGTTETGISTAWPFPQNAYSPLIVAKVAFIWNCQGCSGCMDMCICPQGHPSNGSVRAVRWPDNQLIYMTIQPGRICLSA